jgi:hypothetical protein
MSLAHNARYGYGAGREGMNSPERYDPNWLRLNARHDRGYARANIAKERSLRSAKYDEDRADEEESLLHKKGLHGPGYAKGGEVPKPADSGKQPQKPAGMADKFAKGGKVSTEDMAKTLRRLDAQGPGGLDSEHLHSAKRQGLVVRDVNGNTRLTRMGRKWLNEGLGSEDGEDGYAEGGAVQPSMDELDAILKRVANKKPEDGAAPAKKQSWSERVGGAVSGHNRKLAEALNSEGMARGGKVYHEEPEEEDGPGEEDIFFHPSGHLGSKTSVSAGGKHLGEFHSHEEARKAARAWAEKNKFYPNAWHVSDHGNHEQTDY